MSTPIEGAAGPTHRGRRTAETLDAARAAGRTAGLIGYLPVGYPDVPGSLEAVRELVAGGVDIVEVGMPYSDPGMDGPVIQAASEAALRGGVRTRDVFRAVEAVAEAGGTAVVMSYWNIVLQYGVENFARDLDSAGGAGIVTSDLIPEEAGAWTAASDAYDLDRIFLAAPSSTTERLATIVGAHRGFVYAASTMGVTGTRSSVDTHARELVARVRTAGAAHVCVGLGVSSAAQAAEVAEYADGVIVGSALVKALSSGGPAAVGALARELAEGVGR
ncbi:tryptophan synthase subunit alpha [Brevibacterium sp. 50QC2O2]|uniref:tryptophan synthase subunit alpha n=1 Tax=Brevibacterium TaxID=1696 RepID=UPI00211CC6D4|nr:MULTISPECIES: tryptophan synthase subunit alpha [unclassified Brevibacterium]MCQ9366859.1 tryptophan synthase subunit alpha [Brevibacterium sp. 91QC2O2]MCQ9384009.1 tryptophan synthase subunit alpha [Brevibacterium sp. 68QC2CO]MCQ9389137.1 tryptophan synthase subunit alpha [Brevibacterium sp. 50QC2O2]